MILATFLVAGGGWSPAALHAGTADDDWKAIVALDAGPQTQPRTREEARQTAIGHIDRQERALRVFLSTHPDDSRAFEARLRLSRLLQIRAGFTEKEGPRIEAKRLLEEAAKTATPEQRVEVDFAQITYVMRGLRAPTPEQREHLLGAVRRFQGAYPGDRRLAPLLAEVATLFDAQPRTKRALLADAVAFASDEALKARLSDDIKRLDLVGTVVPLRFISKEGKALDIADYRGKVVVLVFFATWSPPSVTALETIQRSMRQLAREPVQVLGVSLDDKPEELSALLAQQGVAWPVICDGKGWQSPLVRSLGVNALPTVWVLDKEGYLRSLNAMDGLVSRVRQISAAR